MSKEQTKDLLKFLRPFSTDINETVLWLRDFVWDLYPQTNELIYDNYNALAFGWSPTDKVGHTFCSIAVGRTSKNIHFGFYWGSEINDPMQNLLTLHETVAVVVLSQPNRTAAFLTIADEIERRSLFPQSKGGITLAEQIRLRTAISSSKYKHLFKFNKPDRIKLK